MTVIVEMNGDVREHHGDSDSSVSDSDSDFDVSTNRTESASASANGHKELAHKNNIHFRRIRTAKEKVACKEKTLTITTGLI